VITAALAKRPLVIVALCASLFAVTAYGADDGAVAPPPQQRKLEEIIVTAQKTEQDIREVPISMSVLNGEFIERQSISDYRDLGLYVPNAHIDPGNGLFPDINIRGYGSALTNKAFEQSVGLVIDGVPYGRAGYFSGPLFDLERVEVLRGPQGTLFGRNTTAGLMNVVTRRPTGEYTGFVDAEYGELDRRRVEAAIGGPILAKRLEFRISGLYDARDGLMENTTAAVVPSANERMNTRDRKAVRFQLGLPDVLGANFVLGYEKIHFDFRGIGWEWSQVPEQTKAFYRSYDPNTDFVPKNHIGSVDTGEFNDNTLDTFVLNGGYDLGSWHLSVVGGYSILKVRSLIDDDFGPQPMLFNTSVDDDPQGTAEGRIDSPSLPGFLGLDRPFGLALGTSEVTAGFFYQQRQIKNSRLSINFNLPVLAQFAAANTAPPGTPVLPIGDFIGTGLPIPGLGIVDTTPIDEETTMLFAQSTTSYAGYGQLQWHFREPWTLLFGMRFTDESKTAHWHRIVTQGTGVVFTALGGQSTFMTQRERSETAFTPKVALRYDWSDAINFYASWAEGFKAGGFNEQVFNTTDEALEFKSETAQAWELGARLRLFDDTATVNAALYRHDVDDFQVLTLPPNSVATTVVNAGKARSQGVELDAAWLATSWLTLSATLAYNDSEFLSFVLGQCSFDRPDTDGNGDGRCDVTGRPLFRTPRWKTTTVGNVRYPIASLVKRAGATASFLDGIDVLGGLTLEYQDVQYLERTYDPRVRQGPFVRLGANFGFADDRRGWSARVVAENLNDVDTAVLVRDVPLGGGNFARIPEPQRLVFGTVRWGF